MPSSSARITRSCNDEVRWDEGPRNAQRSALAECEKEERGSRSPSACEIVSRESITNGYNFTAGEKYLLWVFVVHKKWRPELHHKTKLRQLVSPLNAVRLRWVWCAWAWAPNEHVAAATRVPSNWMWTLGNLHGFFRILTTRQRLHRWRQQSSTFSRYSFIHSGHNNGGMKTKIAHIMIEKFLWVEFKPMQDSRIEHQIESP